MQANEIWETVSFSILPGKYYNSSPVPSIYNHLYQYWKKTWTEFFDKMGSGPDALNIENFLRHNMILVLHREENILATVSASLFNLTALNTYDHPCIRPFPAKVQKLLQEQQSGQLLTSEYLSVHPDYRKGLIGESLAEVLAGLSIKVFLDLQIAYALAATVRVAKVDQICKKLGYQEVGSYQKIGVDCVMLYNSQETVKENEDKKIQFLVNRLWNRRQDKTGLTSKQKKEIKLVA